MDTYAASLHSFAGNQARTLVISGLRGIGKTALVNELEELARQQGWVTLRAHSTDKDPIATLVESTIPTVIHEQSPPAKRTITGATIAGIGAIQTTVNDDPRPTPTLNSQLRKLAGLLQPHGTGIVISIDEAGLSHGVDKLLQHPGTTFIRRGVRVELQPLSFDEARDLLITTADESAVTMDPAAAANAANFAQGHPYLVQLIGSLSWAKARSAHATQIRDEHIEDTKATAINSLGLQVHQPELTYLTQSETRFVEAMAEAMGENNHADIADIARILGKPVTSMSDVRSRLLRKEVIDASGRGEVRFRLPYFKEYLRLPDSSYPFKQMP